MNHSIARGLLMLVLSVSLSAVCSGTVLPAQPDSVPMTFSTDCLRISEKGGKPETLLLKSVAPALMVGAGSLYHDYNLERAVRNADRPPMDDGISTLMYVPGALMLAASYSMPLTGDDKWMGTKRLVFREAAGFAMQVALTQTLKSLSGRPRPGNDSDYSFPSGHAAFSFFSATVMQHELGDNISPWIGVAGYGVAAGISISRVVSNDHWMSDVIACAGIGIFSAEFGYWLDDVLFGKSDRRRQQMYDPADRKWAFGMYSYYNFNRVASFDDDRSCGDLKPEYTLGVKASCRVGELLSVGLSGDMTQLQWNGNGTLALPDGLNQPFLLSLHACLDAGFNISGTLGAFAGLSAGIAAGRDFSIRDTQDNSRTASIGTGFDSRASAGLSIRTSHCSEIRCFGGLDCRIGYGLSFMAGTSVNLVF